MHLILSIPTIYNLMISYVSLETEMSSCQKPIPLYENIINRVQGSSI